MSEALTPCVREIFGGTKPSGPVVQVNDMKATGGGRIKAVISDGAHFGPAVFGSAVNAMIERGEIKVSSTIRLKEYTANNLAGTKLCLVMGCEHVADLEEKIGEPVSWDVRGPADEVANNATPAKPAAPSMTTPETAAAEARFGSALPAPAMRSPAPVMMGRPIPIDALNPYNNKWTIRARVSSKGDLRSVSTQRGERSVFSMDLCDESSEIRATCWAEAAERFHAMTEVGKVYLISRGQVKIANKKFSTLNNQYEMSLNFDSHIELCDDQAVALPMVRYNFTKIADVAAKPTNAIVDIVGVASEIAPVARLTSKAGKELVKRTFTVADDSGAAIEVTLWAQAAETFPEGGNPVVAFKGLRVTEWNTKSLGAVSSTSFAVDPEVAEAETLRTWWASGGGAGATSLSVSTFKGAERDTTSRTFISEVVDDDVTDQPTYFNTRVWLARVAPNRDNPIWFAACAKCGKKALGDETSGYNCENCGWNGPTPGYRYVLSLAVQDATGQRYVTAFNDTAAALLGKSADALKALKDASNDEYEAVLNAAQWRPKVMRVRAKAETWQQKQKVKCHMMSASRLDWAAEGKLLLAQIQNYPDLPPVEEPTAKAEVDADAKAEAPAEAEMADVKAEAEPEATGAGEADAEIAEADNNADAPEDADAMAE